MFNIITTVHAMDFLAGMFLAGAIFLPIALAAMNIG